MKLPIVYLILTVEFEQPFQKPEYAGSLLRGQFGRMLKSRTCITGTHACLGCPVANNCPAVRLFDPPGQNIPVPYVIQDLTWGSMYIAPHTPWQFKHTLIGPHTIAQTPLIIQIWNHLFQAGFGPQKIKGRVLEVRDGNNNIVAQQKGTQIHIIESLKHLVIPALGGTPLSITLTTPLRLFFKQRQIRPKAFQPEQFFKAIWHRLQALRHGPYGLNELVLDETAKDTLFNTTAETTALGWRTWRRYSTRQKAPQDMSGLIGNLQITPHNETATQLIWLGAQVHIGKNTAFGLGAYETRNFNRL